jgi:hypothetical protein
MVIVALALAGLLLLAGCGNSDGGGRSANQRRLPEVTTLQAEQAMSDAMLVSALSLFLAFGAEESETSVSNQDGSLTLSWDESADFTSGIGTYTVTMAQYTVPEDDPFGTDYNGYVLDGEVVMGSTDGVNTTMTMDLETSHPDPENFPVQLIEMELKSIQADPGAVPEGSIIINGHAVEFEDLARVFSGE